MLVASHAHSTPAQSPLAGFAGTDRHRLIQPDPMHQADKGDTERALDLLNERMDEDSIALINERLASIQPMQGLALPGHGLSSVKMYASEQAALLRCLSVPLLGIEGELLAAMRIVIPGAASHVSGERFCLLQDQEC